MKTRQLGLGFALTGGLGLVILVLRLLAGGPPVLAAPVDRYVRAGGVDVGGCTLPSAPCATVQYAVDVASDGDAIYVAQGIYSDIHFTGSYTQVVYLTKTVDIRGGFASDFGSWDPVLHPTVLDAGGQGRVFYITGDGSRVIEGFRIVNGDAEAGGGGWGGGAFAVGGSGPSLTVTMRHNVVRDNRALVGSGTGNGGGLSFVFCNVVLERNEIGHNETDGSGGGVRLEQSNGELWDNVIRFNQAGTGGGIYLVNLASARMTNTVLSDNTVTSGGSGLVAAGAYARLVHTTLARNSGADGSGVYVTGSGFSAGYVTMTNTIAVSHTVGITVYNSGSPMVPTNKAYVDGVMWYDNGQNVGGSLGEITVTHAYTGAPGFRPDGYHLGPASAAIDLGLEAGVATDIDGETRPTGLAPDLGADEAWRRTFAPVVLRNSGL
jgi:hypothetical protein